MTLANNYNPTKQLANGVTTSFTFNYDMINEDYAAVYQEVDGVQTIVDSDLYTVEFNNNGGNVIFKTAPAAGVYIVIGRSVPFNQETPYKTSSGFPANRVEENLDKLTAITQQLADESDRSPKIPLGTAGVNLNLPAPSAGKAIVWNDEANALVNSTDEFNDIVTDATAQANIAMQKASEAAGSATAAANSASAALTSEGNAASSASAANTSAGNALTSEGNAASSAAEALASQTAAAASENLAQQWATKTDGMVNNEDYSSKYYAQNAQTSATAAASSASAALSSQTAAAESATEAADSETNAATSAGQAATSAGNAAESESNAASSASAALTSQNAAATSAELAQDWATKTDGTVDGEDYSAKYYALQAQAGIPVGTILPWSTDTAPAGFLLCDGSAVSRTTYAGLFAVIGTTYGDGDGNTTFNIPNLSDSRFIEYGTSVGSLKEAGLPNIEGEITSNHSARGLFWEPMNVSGAFTKSSDNGVVSASQTGSSASSKAVYFDASLSNSIYGNSTTVQPKSLVLTGIIKY